MTKSQGGQAPTPGPWASAYDDNGFYYIRAEGSPSPYIMATGGEGETDEANARLAASAPTLAAEHAELADTLEDALNYPGDEHVTERGRALLDRISAGKESSS